MKIEQIIRITKQNLILEILLHDYLFDFNSSLPVAMLFITLVLQSSEATVEHPVSEIDLLISTKQSLYFSIQKVFIFRLKKMVSEVSRVKCRSVLGFS